MAALYPAIVPLGAGWPAARTLARQLAAQTPQVLNISKAGQAVGLEPATANRYAALLEAAFMIQRPPDWGETLGKKPAS